jgi:hypothetical protein
MIIDLVVIFSPGFPRVFKDEVLTLAPTIICSISVAIASSALSILVKLV